MTPISKSIFKKLGNKMLTVVVGEGEDKQDFTVHEDVICGHSDFFRKAMNGKWKESEERVIPLAEEDPETFSMYLQACYTRHVKVDDETSLSTATIIWASVYALAEKLMDRETKNAVAKEFYKRRRDLWELYDTIGDAVQIIYDTTPNRSKLGKLLVDAAVYYHDCLHEDKPKYNAALRKVPRDFLQDLAVGMAMKKYGVHEGAPCIHDRDWSLDAEFYDYLGRYLETVGKEKLKAADCSRFTSRKVHRHCVWDQEAHKAEAEREASGSEAGGDGVD